MPDDVKEIDFLAGATLKLRSALSIALLALGNIEKAETLEDARAAAKAARHQARAVLSTVASKKAAQKDR